MMLADYGADVLKSSLYTEISAEHGVQLMKRAERADFTVT